MGRRKHQDRIDAMPHNGCATDTMRSYVGQDIREVELTYGPPINKIDMRNESRAFQWAKILGNTIPASAITTTGEIGEVASPRRLNSWEATRP